MNFNFITKFINDTTSDGWLSVIGGLLGFLGILLTIRNTKKQFERDKKLDVKPYLDVRISPPTDIKYTLEVIPICKSSDLLSAKGEDVGIKITNLGQGHCLMCNLINIKYQNRSIQNKKEIGNIKTNETSTYNIYFFLGYESVLKRLEEKYKNQDIKNYNNIELFTKIKEETQNKVELIFEYEDVLGTRYNKKIIINVYMRLEVLHIKSKIQTFKFESFEYEVYDEYEKEVKS